MRLCTNSTALIEHEGTILGINLGFDFCAEHEWGIGWTSRYLGFHPVSPTNYGIDARVNRTMELNLELADYKGVLWLRGEPARGWGDPLPLMEEVVAKRKDQGRSVGDICNRLEYKPDDLAAAWSDSGGFMVAGRSDKHREAIKLIHKALIDHSCFINQASGFLGRGGLCLVEGKLIPDEFRESMAAGDLSNFKLNDAVAADGILDRLEKAGKRYYACSPRWTDDTETAFNFWLNPEQQHIYMYGWMTSQDLDDWIAGTGKVMEKKK